MREKRLLEDGNGFRELQAELAQQGNRFYRFAFRLCGSREDAEDIVVTAFAKACQNHHRIRDAEALVTWLYRIVVNEWRMHRRRRQIDSVPLSKFDEVGIEMSTDHIALSQALGNLSSKQREALVLVKGEGLTLQEAAGVLRRPVTTVASQVTQAMTLLRRELFPAGQGHGAEIGSARLSHELP